MDILLAMAPSPDGSGGGGSMVSTLIMFGAIFAIVYFMIIRPQMKKKNSQTGESRDFDIKPSLLNFGVLISKTLITVLFYLGAIAIVFAGISLINKDQGSIGIPVLIFGVLLWRIICEGAIVVFNIHDYVRNINYILPDLLIQLKLNNKDKKEE